MDSQQFVTGFQGGAEKSVPTGFDKKKRRIIKKIKKKLESQGVTEIPDTRAVEALYITPKLPSTAALLRTNQKATLRNSLGNEVKLNLPSLSGLFGDGVFAAETNRPILSAIAGFMREIQINYQNMPAVSEARAELVRKIEELFDVQAASDLKSFIERGMLWYLHADQYHNAEHMLRMTRDILELANLAYNRDTRKSNGFKQILNQLVISGVYHDACNAEHPDKPGVDEFEAVCKFLEDSSKDHLSVLDKKQIVANILGTVFRDRLLSANQLENLSRLRPESLNYIQKAVRIMHEKYGIETNVHEIASLMVSKEAWVVKNADVLSSFKRSCLKNSILNFSEDSLCKPHVLGLSASEYHQGFVRFLLGKFHSLDETEFSKKARSGYPLLMPGEQDDSVVELYGKRLFEESRNFFEVVLAAHSGILDALNIVATRAAQNKTKKLSSMTLAEIKQALEVMNDAGDAHLNNGSVVDVDLKNYPGLSTYADRTIAELTPQQVIEIFAPGMEASYVKRVGEEFLEAEK